MAVQGVVGLHGVDHPAFRDLFEATFALSSAAVAVIDDERRFWEVSQAACAILGRDRDELLARRIDDCLPLASQARLRAAWPGCLGVEVRKHEIEFIRPDGSLAMVAMSARANIVPGRHLLTLDASPDHRRDEEDIDRLFADSTDMLVVAGDDGYLTRVNPACERVLGYPLEELLGTPYLDRVHPDDLAKTLDTLGWLRRGTPSCTITHRLRCQGGGYVAVEWHVAFAQGRGWLTAVGRVVPQLAEVDAPGPSLVRGAVTNLAAARQQAKRQEWLADEAYPGIEPSLVLAIEQQLQIVDDLTLSAAEPRVAAVRCALALRQSLVEMGTIVADLRGPLTLAAPAGGGSEPRPRRSPASPAPAAAGLTEREYEVVRLVAQGHDNRMIGGELFLAEVTVKKHVQSIMSKFGATSRIQAAIAAIKLGLDH